MEEPLKVQPEKFEEIIDHESKWLEEPIYSAIEEESKIQGMEEQIPFSLGFIESPPDYRDVPLSAVVAEDVLLPDSYEIDVSQLPAWNQKQIGSCIGHASAKKKQTMDFIETKQVFQLSPRFVYALCKSIDGLPYEGTYYRLAGKILMDYGCATESTVPNNCNLSHAEYIDLKNIPDEAYKEAKPFAIKGYAYVNPHDLNELRRGIMQGGVLLGMKLDKNWWTNRDGIRSYKPEDLFPLRVPEQILGGHAVFAYKWDTVDGRVRIWIINSFGDQWGIQGKGYFFWDEYNAFSENGVPGLVEGWTYVDLPNDWVKEVKELPKAPEFKYNFTKNLVKGQTNDDVKNLQIALKILGYFPSWQKTTGFYGNITQAAVMAFQYKYQIASVEELREVSGTKVGPKTRLKLNELFNK